jgi:AbrB family looped-hinge helix DNA binding protein
MDDVRGQVLGKATVTSKGQLTIPVRVRRALGIAQGERVVFEAHAQGVLIRRAARARDLLGVVPPVPTDWKSMRRRAWADRAERLDGRVRPERSSATPTSSSGS